MDGPSDLLVTLLLFVGLMLNWVKAIVCAAVANLVRPARLSLGLAVVLGALEGLVGSRLELLDIYLTRDGWVSFDLLAALTMALSALGSVVWWLVFRGCRAVAYRVWGTRDPARTA